MGKRPMELDDADRKPASDGYIFALPGCVHEPQTFYFATRREPERYCLKCGKWLSPDE